MEIGERILIFRKRAKLNQSDLAGLVGVSRSTIANYENNTTSPDINTALKIASALDISINQLLGN